VNGTLMLALLEEEGMQQLPLLAPQPLFSFFKKNLPHNAS
jgi:hypothetical protein